MIPDDDLTVEEYELILYGSVHFAGLCRYCESKGLMNNYRTYSYTVDQIDCTGCGDNW